MLELLLLLLFLLLLLNYYYIIYIFLSFRNKQIKKTCQLFNHKINKQNQQKKKLKPNFQKFLYSKGNREIIGPNVFVLQGKKYIADSVLTYQT